MEVIGIEDFLKLDIRLAKIVDAQRVEGSEKLLKLKVSLGGEERVVVAGIAKHYKPDELIGKKILLLANLKPRKIMGIESQGMVLALSDGERLSLIVPDREMEEGTRVS
ncbi:MAG: methionine--tRNA ligase subunit beta [Hydrogenobacter thermophilus]|uniref:methionine--tRNA ligase subunit beta n=1 Tax=Hydrogenobacter thermophilus TaxID=940 RepID=UPI001C749B50|nr:methionine--tRNA ligase subunit beta [Hydrogenobacter thermophilus]QWK20021.1 MAG: methionine--tRNA ligase subunit beta [Hydrogenobacter thermophilus]